MLQALPTMVYCFSTQAVHRPNPNPNLYPYLPLPLPLTLPLTLNLSLTLPRPSTCPRSRRCTCRPTGRPR